MSDTPRTDCLECGAPDGTHNQTCPHYVVTLQRELAAAQAKYESAAAVTGNMMREYAEMRDRLTKLDAAARLLSVAWGLKTPLARGEAWLIRFVYTTGGKVMSKVICPESGSQLTIGSTTIPTWRERIYPLDEHSTAHIRVAMQSEINNLRAELARVEDATIERCAKLFDGFTYGPYAHPSKAIRALAKPADSAGKEGGE